MNDILLGSNPPPVEYSEGWKNNLQRYIIKEIEKSGLSQGKYSVQIGVPQTYISLIKNGHYENVGNIILKELAIKSGFMDGYLKPCKPYNSEIPQGEKAVEIPNEKQREPIIKPKDIAAIESYLDKRQLTTNLIGEIKQDFRHFLLQDLIKKLDTIRADEL